MAKLVSDQLALEICFREFDDCCWLQYEVLFLWQGLPMVEDRLLKRSPSGWADRRKGTFKANEYDGDTLLPVIRRMLDEKNPQYWEPTEPDVIIAFYPEKRFPLIPSHQKIIWEAPHIKQERRQRKAAKAAAGGRLPDDIISVAAFIDAYNWQHCAAYYGDGLALIMHARRDALEQFYADLSREYKEFSRKWRIKERLRQRDRLR